MIENPTPGQLRTRNAIAANRRRRERRMADELISLGWTCTPPQESKDPDKRADR